MSYVFHVTHDTYGSRYQHENPIILVGRGGEYSPPLLSSSSSLAYHSRPPGGAPAGEVVHRPGGPPRPLNEVE